MFSRSKNRLALAAIAGLMGIFAASPVLAVRINFGQTDFEDFFGGTPDSGSLLGSFEFDENALAVPGQVSLGDLTDFMSDFSGSSIITPAQSWSLADLASFIYDFGANVSNTGDDLFLEFEATNPGNFSLSAFTGTDGNIPNTENTAVTNNNLGDEVVAEGNFIHTVEPTKVPEASPSGWLWLLLGLGALFSRKLAD